MGEITPTWARRLELAIWCTVGALLLLFGLEVAANAARMSDGIVAAYALVFVTFGGAFLALAIRRP